MCRDVEEVIGSVILDLLPGLLQLEVHYFCFKGDISHEIGNGLMGTVEDSVEH